MFLSRRSLFSILLIPSVLVLVGCESSPKIVREEQFGPAKVRLHPTFTQVKDWTNDKKPDGIEAVVELQDSFGEPIRASGKLLFELYDYREDQPEHSGARINEPWTVELLTDEQQKAHWSPALRAYTFRLPRPSIDNRKRFVLAVSYETAGGAARAGGGRLFDRIVIEPAPDKLKPEKEVHRGGSGKRQ